MDFVTRGLMTSARKGKPTKQDLTIELGRGATYVSHEFMVYEHSTYERTSVLAGQPKRVYLNSFETVEEAQKAYPTAQVINGSTYAPPNLSHLRDDEDY